MNRQTPIVVAGVLLLVIGGAMGLWWGSRSASQHGAGGRANENAGQMVDDADARRESGGIASAFSSEPAAYARLDELQREIHRMSANFSLPFEQRIGASERFREALMELSDDERTAYMTSRLDKMQQAALEEQEKYADSVLNLSADEQTKAIDQMIDVMVADMQGQLGVIIRHQQTLAAKLEAQQPQTFGQDGAGQSKLAQKSKEDVNFTSSQYRSKMDELQRKMRARMSERGIEVPR